MSEDLKRCPKCYNENIMTDFHKKSKSNKSCGKQYYNENLVKI